MYKISRATRRRNVSTWTVYFAASIVPEEDIRGRKRSTRVAVSHHVNTTVDLEQPWAERKEESFVRA